MKHGDLDTLRRTRPRNGVERRSFSGEKSTLAVTTLDPGHVPSPHSHEHEQLVYIASGRARFTVGGEELEVGPGSLVHVPAGVEHFAEAIGEEPVLDFSFFAPRRDDYAAEAEG